MKTSSVVAMILMIAMAGASAQTSGSASPPAHSPGAPNTGPPTEALFPALAAWQDRLEEEGWLLRGQATFVLQGHAGFHSPYRDAGSLRPKAQARNTFSSDLLLGRRLWEGAEVIVNASVTRGFGVSNTVGLAAYPSNEAFKRGTEEPYFYVPRIMVRQTIALSGDTVPGDYDALRFSRPLPRERVTVTVGRMSVWDIFDDNRYAHDARTQFLNWTMVGAGAVDWAADTRGWTNGAAVEWDNGTWGVRAGAFQVARMVNGLSLDTAMTRAWQALFEVDRFFRINDRPGAIRMIYGASRARQSTWTELFANGFDTIIRNPNGYRVKHMVALNLEQELTDELGLFARASWNDGRTQTWAFTDMDRSISVGLQMIGQRWNRPGDTIGLASNVGWISAGRQRYLEAGGIGIITGDGRLNYRPEYALETYYDMRVAPGVNAALNYQFVANPAYNADRGPVHLLALRMRTAF